MRLLALFVTILAIALAQAQDYAQLFPGFGSYIRPQQLQGPPQQASTFRDPRTNTGPVLFPPGPPGNPADTSGVIVGASGYGFVPPHSGLGLNVGRTITPLKRPLNIVPAGVRVPPSVKIISSPYRPYLPSFFSYLY